MRIQREAEEGDLEYGRSSPAASQPANELLPPLLPLAALKGYLIRKASLGGSYQLATSSSSCVPELGSTPSQFFYRYGATLEEYSAVEDELDPVAYNNNQLAGGSGSVELGVWRKKKKAKSRLSKEQVKWLETWFKEETKLEPGRKNELAGALGLQPRQVSVWFQNRRARCRTKQLELDFQQLQTQYDLLLQDKHNLLSQISTLKELVRKKAANGKEEEELLEMLEVEPTNGEKPTHVNSHGHDDRSITMTCSDYAVTTEGEEEEEEEEEQIKMKKKMKIAEPQLSSNKPVNDDVEPRQSPRANMMSEDLGLSCASNGFEDPHYPNSFNTNYNNAMSMTIMQNNNNNNNNNNEYCSQSQYSNWERLPMQFQMGAKFGEGYLQLQDDLCCMFNPHHVHPDDTQALMGCFQETHN